MRVKIYADRSEASEPLGLVEHEGEDDADDDDALSGVHGDPIQALWNRREG